MALNQTKKLDIDDTQPLNCTFLNTETNRDHIVYIIKVQRGIDSKYSWQIKKRYNDFKELNAYLTISNYDLQLPPAKIFGNKDKDFLMTRQNGLQNYMDKVLGNLFLSMSLSVKKFLDQENYTENFKEMALAHVSMFFRSDSNWQVIEPLNEIGWRFRKQHILLKNSEYPNGKFMLTWIEHGPDKNLKEAELKTIFQHMTQIQHEYIDPILQINSGDLSTIVIQRFNEKFISLRDYINGITKINAPFLKKYALHPQYQKIPINLVKQIAKKILVTLKFIYSKGLFYGHLHSGNVLIEQNGNTIKLTDLPNALLGLPFLYRSFVVEQRKISTIEQMDVYGFGHILYEMVYGAPLISSSSRRDFEDCENKELKPLLELLLSDEMLARKSLPTIEELLEIPFFKNTNIEVLPTSSVTAAASTSSASNSNTKLFSSTKVKESLTKAREFIEKKVLDEQKIIYKSKRQSQAEAKVLSEQEIRKRRKEKKKAEKESANSLEFPSPQTDQTNISYKKLSSRTSRESNISDIEPISPPPTTPSRSTPGGPFTPTSPTLTPVPPPPPPQLSSGPPPPPPPPSMSSGGPPPPPPPAITSTPSTTPDRSQLLSSITSFSKGALKKTKTIDKSAPKI